jgi:hypothetical protein
LASTDVFSAAGGNSGTLDLSAISKITSKRRAFEPVFMAKTPKTRLCHFSVPTLVDTNDQQIGIDWRFTAEDARIKLKRLYPIVKVRKST